MTTINLRIVGAFLQSAFKRIILYSKILLCGCTEYNLWRTLDSRSSIKVDRFIIRIITLITFTLINIVVLGLITFTIKLRIGMVIGKYLMVIGRA